MDFSDRAPRRRRRRRLLIALGVILVVGLSIWLVWFSPVLQVRDVRVVGVEGLRAQEVLAAADVSTGTPLARLDAAAAEESVRALPWVSGVEVRRGWPSEVVLAVEARTPIAVLEGGEADLGLDADGVAFTSAEPLSRRLPRVRAEGAPLTAAMTVISELPEDLLKRVVSVTATTIDDVDLHLRSGDVVRWGSAQDGETKAEVLRALLRRKADLYDVSAPELPTTFRLS